ncbi:MAG: glycosyltransferase [Chitinophagaceae bacterium]|nr:glycosyltransferase [Chitinophagaceae bacterium]
MRVSIITVCLNSEKYLSDCIESVRNQSYHDIEYIVIDGGSTDKTLEIINRNLHVISRFKCEPDRGMYDAINKGIRMATGDIIGVLNSDDIFASADSISNIVDCFQLNETDSVYGDLVYVSPENTESITRFWKGKEFRRFRFKFGWMPAHPTFYIRRDLIQEHGLYENHFYTAADYEFMARYLYRHRCSATYLDEIIVKMRCGGLSNGSLKRRLRANRRDYLAMKKNHIPFPFLVSVLKPLSKIHQYKKSHLAKADVAMKEKSLITYVKANSANFTHVESVQ